MVYCRSLVPRFLSLAVCDKSLGGTWNKASIVVDSSATAIYKVQYMWTRLDFAQCTKCAASVIHNP